MSDNAARAGIITSGIGEYDQKLEAWGANAIRSGGLCRRQRLTGGVRTFGLGGDRGKANGPAIPIRAASPMDQDQNRRAELGSIA